MISVEDYLSGELITETKHEYLGGVVHAMAGAKVGHNRATVNILRSLVIRSMVSPASLSTAI